MFRFGGPTGRARTGASVYELPPGQSICPYHYEYGEEEWLLVLEGTASVRTPEGTEPLERTCERVFERGTGRRRTGRAASASG